jgi:hypothetical protein
MLAALDDLTTAADRVRAWVTAKYAAMAKTHPAMA